VYVSPSSIVTSTGAIASRDGGRRYGGMVLRDGAYEHIRHATIETKWNGDDQYHTDVRATATTDADTYEITGRVLRLGYRIHEVPIDYYARSRAEGKKLTWMDGVKALVALGRIRLASQQQLFGQQDAYHAERLKQLAEAPRIPALPGEVPAKRKAA